MKNSALRASAAKDFPEALQLIDQVAAQYGDTLQACDARIRKGYILCRAGQMAQAAAAFQQALEANAILGADHPFNNEARFRLRNISHGAFYGKYELDKSSAKDVAELTEAWLAALPKGNPDEAHAILQSAGVLFEILQREIMGGGTVEPARWEEVRALLRESRDTPKADGHTLITSSLMEVETYSWEKRYEDAVALGLQVLAGADAKAYPREINTLKLFLGSGLMKLQRYEEALKFTQEVIEACADQDELWPRMDHLPRAYSRRWYILKEMGADQEAIDDAARALVRRYPASSYSEAIVGQPGPLTEELNRIRDEALKK